MSQSIQCVHVLGARLFCCANGGGRHANKCDIEKELAVQPLKILREKMRCFLKSYL